MSNLRVYSAKYRPVDKFNFSPDQSQSETRRNLGCHDAHCQNNMSHANDELLMVTG